MKLAHNIKVKDDDKLAETLVCPLCEYTTRNMNEFKNHMTKVHKKDEWNWSLDIKAVHFCDECEVEFPEKSMLRKHIDSGHIEVSQIIVDDTVKKQEHVQKKRDPNLRELPEIVKPLVKKGSEEYIVKGDGSCMVRTTAANITGDEDNGPQLGRDLNTHLSNYREVYKEKISADFPLTITIGVKGETKQFNTSDEYFDWLQESKEAAFKWNTCVDVIAITNMTQLDIDVIVHEEGKKPIMNKFKPDPLFPWRVDDKMAPTFENKEVRGKMTILNWKNTHFNLIVGPEHMLSQVGSIGFQSSSTTGPDQSLPPLTEKTVRFEEKRAGEETPSSSHEEHNSKDEIPCKE